MRQSEFQWTARDGLQIFAGEWAPQEKRPEGVVCLVHGYAEHSARYSHVAADLTRSGFVCLACDLRGHGKSGGKRGHTPSYEALLDDVELLLDNAKERYPELPRFLYGHSMGGNLVLNYSLRRRPEIAGVVAASPWLRLAREPAGPVILLARLMNRLAPAATLKIKLDAAGLSHDREVVSAYQNDPLIFNEISFGLFTAIHDSGSWAVGYAFDFPLPLLIMHGDADPVTSVEASRRLAGKAPGRCTLKIWPGLFHELHNEPQKQEVLAYVKGWLGRHL